MKFINGLTLENRRNVIFGSELTLDELTEMLSEMEKRMFAFKGQDIKLDYIDLGLDISIISENHAKHLGIA